MQNNSPTKRTLLPLPTLVKNNKNVKLNTYYRHWLHIYIYAYTIYIYLLCHLRISHELLNFSTSNDSSIEKNLVQLGLHNKNLKGAYTYSLGRGCTQETLINENHR